MGWVGRGGTYGAGAAGGEGSVGEVGAAQLGEHQEGGSRGRGGP